MQWMVLFVLGNLQEFSDSTFRIDAILKYYCNLQKTVQTKREQHDKGSTSTEPYEKHKMIRFIE